MDFNLDAYHCPVLVGPTTLHFAEKFIVCLHLAMYLPLDVLQHVLMPLEEVEMLELCIVSLRLHQATLLNVYHLTETI